jgi:MOSC domain-containing protein YiiM
MIVARPAVGERRVLDVGDVTVERGLVGDDWYERGSRRTDDGRAHPDMQLTLVNRRFLDLVAGARDRWPLAGDQLIVDLDLSTANLAPGQQLRIGSELVEVTSVPHTGCRKYTDRYGKDAVVFANGEVGRQLRLRGMYVRVVASGTLRVGDTITRL